MLKNKIALVTGGSQGIGKAISEKLLGADAVVAVAGLDDQALKNASAEFQSLGFRFHAEKHGRPDGSGTDPARLEGAFARLGTFHPRVCCDRFGQGPLWI